LTPFKELVSAQNICINFNTIFAAKSTHVCSNFHAFSCHHVFIHAYHTVLADTFNTNISKSAVIVSPSTWKLCHNSEMCLYRLCVLSVIRHSCCYLSFQKQTWNTQNTFAHFSSMFDSYYKQAILVLMFTVFEVRLFTVIETSWDFCFCVLTLNLNS
jgi:hypothetical protein